MPKKIIKTSKTVYQDTGHLWLTCGALLLSAMLILGCAQRYYDLPEDPGPKVPKVERSQTQLDPEGRFKTAFLVDQIDHYYRGSSNGPIGVTTLVNLDDLYESSTFGRMYAEQVMSELVQRGFDVVELRHSDALQFLASAGELAMSRDTGNVKRSWDLAGVVVGTYVDSPVRVYVNMRLLDPATSVVMSAGAVEIIKTKEMVKLLRGNSMPATLERIPVKHLGLKSLPMIQPYQVAPYEDEEDSFAPPPYPVKASRPPPAPEAQLPAGKTEVVPEVAKDKKP